jgi:hypothetical protein
MDADLARAWTKDAIFSTGSNVGCCLVDGSEVHSSAPIHGEDLESLFLSLDRLTHLVVNLSHGSDEIFYICLRTTFCNYLRAF